MRAIVVDIGGTHLRCAAVRADGALASTAKIRIARDSATEPSREIWTLVVSKIAQYVRRVSSGDTTAVPLVVAFPGPIAGRVAALSAPTLLGPDGVMPDIAGDLGRATGCPVWLINDVAAAAWHVSHRVAASRFMVVTISSGIGSKVFDRRHPLRVLDDPPYAGELGHLVVDTTADALPCDCGGRGHLGAIASGRGIERTARVSAARERASFDASMCAVRFGGTAATLSNEAHLVPAARLGDAWTLDVIRRCTTPLAATLTAMFLGIGLEQVIVIGGLAQALGSTYATILREELRRFSDYALIRTQHAEWITFVPGDEETCLLGAAAYAASLSVEAT